MFPKKNPREADVRFRFSDLPPLSGGQTKGLPQILLLINIFSCGDILLQPPKNASKMKQGLSCDSPFVDPCALPRKVGFVTAGIHRRSLLGVSEDLVAGGRAPLRGRLDLQRSRGRRAIRHGAAAHGRLGRPLEGGGGRPRLLGAGQLHESVPALDRRHAPGVPSAAPRVGCRRRPMAARRIRCLLQRPFGISQ